uniref:putative CRISPR-associated protein n=1 Tax=Mesotoga prima TaxID=1184387 RepID=UPI002FDA7A5E
MHFEGRQGETIINTIICTVGASLRKLCNMTSSGITDRLLNLNDPIGNREFGAEINSLASILSQSVLSSRDYLYFLTSDTEEGKKIGDALKLFFDCSKDMSFKNVSVNAISDLDDSRPDDFQNKGLRNLVKRIAEIYKHHMDNLLINATGGYKAQIALSLAFGMGVKIPVYYRFETFDGVIKLPPMPLSLDVELWL